jgi:hypothetical protein
MRKEVGPTGKGQTIKTELARDEKHGHHIILEFQRKKC